MAAWRHDYIVAHLGGGDAALYAAPRHHGRAWSQAALKDLVPADRPAALLRNEPRHPFDKVTLQFVLVFEPFGLHPGMAPRTLLPRLFRHLIPAKVDEFRREQTDYLGKNVLIHLIYSFVAGA